MHIFTILVNIVVYISISLMINVSPLASNTNSRRHVILTKTNTLECDNAKSNIHSRRYYRVNGDSIVIRPNTPKFGLLSKLTFNVSAVTGRRVDYVNCSNSAAELCLRWNSSASAYLTVAAIDDNCERLRYVTDSNVTLSVEFEINGNLYGGPERDLQTWPIQWVELDEVAYVSSQFDSRGVLESYWLDSNGQYIYVDQTVPLFVEMTSAKLRLSARRSAPYARRTNQTILDLLMCSFDDSKTAHMDAVQRVLGKPESTPDFSMVKWPIWSTWAQFKGNISQHKLKSLSDSIEQYLRDMKMQFEIDDNWETCYGSLTVDARKFHNLKGYVQGLQAKSHRVSMWIHPFINVACEPYFSLANASGYLVQNQEGSTVTNWWRGEGGYVDFTNPAAAKWWTSRLAKLKESTGVDSFKFDAGESGWCPPTVAKFFTQRDDHPETILKSYVNTVRQFGAGIEVRVGRATQSVGSFVRMLDRQTSWNGALGLSTLIPTLLHFNIVGYPFVLPDMIGGNAYDGTVVTEEMYIRWLQANVFMPTLQFSLPPWTLSEQAVNLTNQFVALHGQYADKIHMLMVESTKSGRPVNLPLWWLDPSDQTAQSIGSEFLLGEDILVAPVLYEGARQRDIYFPKGQWKDENDRSKAIINGPKWIMNYTAPLTMLPYFSSVTKTN